MSDSNDDVYEVAARLGDVEVFEMDNLRDILSVDLDGKSPNMEVLQVMREQGLTAQDQYGDVVLRTFSRSHFKEGATEDRTHLYVRVYDSLDLPTRSALQAAIGSDPKREALSMVRLIHASRIPAQVMFETAVEADKLREWLGPKRTALAQPKDSNAREKAIMEAVQDDLDEDDYPF